MQKSIQGGSCLARSVNNDPVQKKLWKQKINKGTIYNNAIRHYIKTQNNKAKH